MSAATARHSEPSMEDILASIRKIISDDLDGHASPPAEESASADVYDLAEQVAFQTQKDAALASPLGVAAQEQPAQQIVSDPVAVVTELAARMRHAAETARPEKVGTPKAEAEMAQAAEASLTLSRTTHNAVASALEALRQSPAPAPAVAPKDATDAVLRGLVEAALRPVLAQWLDKNLPGIVERLVKAEIERISQDR